MGGYDNIKITKPEDLLFGELAVALEISRESVKDYISARLGTAVE